MPLQQPYTSQRPGFELPERLPVRTRFLPPDANVTQRIRAAAANHVSWFTTNTLLDGGEVHHEKGVMWTCTAEGGDIAFPRLAAGEAPEVLDRLVEYYRDRKPQRVGCWSLTPSHPRDLGALLAARGFEWGWRPHWMGLDVRNLNDDFTLPAGLRIAVDVDSDWDVNDLPYYKREELVHRRALAAAMPRRDWHFSAWQQERIVGHCQLHLTTGAQGVAGLYNVGVVPAARKQGIGRALMVSAGRFAQALGCHHALLNSAASEFYARIGFASLGYGQTWWMHAAALAAPPPTPAQVAFAEAVGRGDTKILTEQHDRIAPDDLDAPLPCGMTPMELAVRAQKPAAARWLAAQGATLDVLHAWDLGWKDRIPQMLDETPGLANRRTGLWQTTPMHQAAERNNVALAQLLLTANPDLSIRDTQFNSTPLNWARHLRHGDIIALLESYQPPS